MPKVLTSCIYFDAMIEWMKTWISAKSKRSLIGNQSNNVTSTNQLVPALIEKLTEFWKIWMNDGPRAF